MRNLEIKRMVVKIGTNTLCREDGSINKEYLEDVARQLVELEARHIQCIVVSSGAIGAGSSELGLDGVQKDVAMKQACAAVGQSLLMRAWREAFSVYGKKVGQVLLTYGAFSDRTRHLNLKNAIDELFRLNAVPIVNENDVIATDEIDEIFGDNDKLSALVAGSTDADLLLLLTDVDGLYDRNPDADPHALLIPVVDEITEDILRIAGSKKNERSTGGMRTKINAAMIAMECGFAMVIANGKLDDVILRVAAAEEIGTLFTPSSHYSNRERWLAYAFPRGTIYLDEGAEEAIRNGRSLLPCGITAVEGVFKRGEVVRIGTFAKGVANFSSEELEAQLALCRSEREEGKRNKNESAFVSSSNIIITSNNP